MEIRCNRQGSPDGHAGSSKFAAENGEAKKAAADGMDTRWGQQHPGTNASDSWQDRQGGEGPDEGGKTSPWACATARLGRHERRKADAVVCGTVLNSRIGSKFPVFRLVTKRASSLCVAHDTFFLFHLMIDTGLCRPSDWPPQSLQ